MVHYANRGTGQGEAADRSSGDPGGLLTRGWKAIFNKI
jgi:hypothetical protein